MKKYILILMAALMTVTCSKPQYPSFFVPGSDDFTHDNVEISSMIMYSTGKAIQSTLEATIDHEAGTVKFIVPRANRDKFDLTKVKLSATIFYDAEITPSLSGKIWDVTSDDSGNPKIKLTVRSTITGKTKEYTVNGYVSSL